MAGTDETAESTGGAKRKLRVWWVIAGLLAAGLFIGARVFLSYINTPASAARITNQPAHVSVPAAAGNEPVSVSDAYARFTYPSFLTPLKVQQPNGGSVAAVHSYEYKAAVPWQLTVTVNRLPGGLANNDSAYYAMIQNPARYQKTTENVNGGPVTILSDLTTGGFSKIAFLFHGGYSADIALNGSDQQDADREQATLDGVIQSWRWQ